MTQHPPSRLKVSLAFAAIYLIWGSTYLAIAYSIETLPPYLMTGFRFLFGGLLLYGWARLRGVAAPRGRQWGPAVLIGALMLFGGMGLVAFAQQWVPSGLTALIIAMVPVWLVLIEWLRPNGVRPSARVWLGIALSFVGLVLLIGPLNLDGASDVNLMGAGLVLLATLSWSAGSMLSRNAQLPDSPILSTGMQMLSASVLLLSTGMLRGELGQVHLALVSARSLLGWAYLVVFGSVIAFTAYLWLLKVSTPAQVGTYAYVNPVIAVLLGWSLNGETLSPQTLLGAGLVIAAVVFIVTQQRKPKPHTAPEPRACRER